MQRFRELQNFSVTPPPTLWQRIEKSIERRQKRKRWLYLSAAAIITLLLSITLWWKHNHTNEHPTIVVMPSPTFEIVIPECEEKLLSKIPIQKTTKIRASRKVEVKKKFKTFKIPKKVEIDKGTLIVLSKLPTLHLEALEWGRAVTYPRPEIVLPTPVKRAYFFVLWSERKKKIVLQPSSQLRLAYYQVNP